VCELCARSARMLRFGATILNCGQSVVRGYFRFARHSRPIAKMLGNGPHLSRIERLWEIRCLATGVVFAPEGGGGKACPEGHEKNQLHLYCRFLDDHHHQCGHANFEVLGASTLSRHGFNDALRSHGWNNSRELVIGGIEQSTKLSFGAFPSSSHH
jgi:hypothetical protein